jgi:4-hydroxyphenylpyruvate dioxygenase
VPLSARTRAARAVGASGGAGVQHLAFATDDIFATVRRWREAGVPLSPVPDNYYDDLATRFELDPALLARLREHAVLFDRSGDGDWFHAGTETFADRFHFEAVQRTGGYDGFGAPNAPVRMAWQAQKDAELQK